MVDVWVSSLDVCMCGGRFGRAAAVRCWRNSGLYKICVHIRTLLSFVAVGLPFLGSFHRIVEGARRSARSARCVSVGLGLWRCAAVDGARLVQHIRNLPVSLIVGFAVVGLALPV